MILGVKELILFPQKCKWAPAKCENQKSERKLGKVKGGTLCWSGISSHLQWEGRGVAVLPVIHTTETGLSCDRMDVLASKLAEVCW